MTDLDQNNRKTGKTTMQRPGLLNTTLGESTTGLLTFQHDMFRSNLCEISESATSAQTEKTADTATGKSHKLRFFTPGRDRRCEDADISKLSLSPKNTTTNKQRSSSIDEKPKGFFRTKSSTSPTIGSTRAKSTMRSCFDDSDQVASSPPRARSVMRHGSSNNDSIPSSSSQKDGKSHDVSKNRNGRDDFDTTSVTSNSSNSAKFSPLQENISRSPPRLTRERHAPPGRSRPGIRTCRSGSFALRQFQMNHQQNQPARHYKTKAEAQGSRTTERMSNHTESLQEDGSESNEWDKPKLRPCRSMDPLLGFTGEIEPSKPMAGMKTTGEEVDFGGSTHATEATHRSCGTNFTRNIVEVAPGSHMAMAGIDETMHALHLDRIAHVECTSCDTFLACLNTASMVLCPGCQSISPIEGAPSLQSFDQMPILGFGLRVEDILKEIQN